MEEKYITIAEAGKLIDVTPAWIYELIKKHNIKTKERRGIKVCKESDILKLDELVESK
ncbi:MAG: hypothetical protein V3W20_08355 [Candidatus Neomarinimicrobiota bacterium]